MLFSTSGSPSLAAHLKPAYKQSDKLVCTSAVKPPESSFRVRVDEPLHKEFLETCRHNDLTASQVIRSFIRSYVHNTIGGLQLDFSLPV